MASGWLFVFTLIVASVSPIFLRGGEDTVNTARDHFKAIVNCGIGISVQMNLRRKMTGRNDAR
jgi:hypothetical protein